ncbi:MAG TPA: HD domain-containing protein [Flavobacteriaceae bacterium]|nr:HD domain-containing protein [Flavobacteriaceae bacterium]
MLNKQLILEVENYVQSLLLKALPKHFVYHNYTHAQNVVNATQLIANEENISEEELNLVLISAWFHDTGFIKSIENHEAESIKIAENFLLNTNVKKETIQQIAHIILATKMPQTPKNKLEQIMCDADLYHLGTDSFNVKSNILRKEWELTNVITFTEEEWLKNNVLFLKNHSFFTNYAKHNLALKKQQNLQQAKQDLKAYIAKKQKNKC